MRYPPGGANAGHHLWTELNPGHGWVVDYARKALRQACLSALAANICAVPEWYLSVAVKLLQQTPTQVLPRSCRLIGCCANTLVHVHPTRPLLHAGV